MSADERIERAGLLYERAVFGGDTRAPATADRELDAAGVGAHDILPSIHEARSHLWPTGRLEQRTDSAYAS